jgi:hypothetical protein
MITVKYLKLAKHINHENVHKNHETVHAFLYIYIYINRETVHEKPGNSSLKKDKTVLEL